MDLLFVTPEAAPFSKTGGLGDVCGALPHALAALGHRVLVVTPGYRGAVPPLARRLPDRRTLHFPFGDVSFSLATLEPSRGLTVAFVECPAFFDRAGLYGEGGVDYPDNARRFCFFGVAALAAAQWLDFPAQVVHLHDWQTGLAALALKRGFQGTRLGEARTVFTLHNLAYQGCFPKTEVDALGLGWDAFGPDGVEFYDQLCFLKAGLTLADALTTVSPSYAREVQTPEGGFGLDGVLRARADRFEGILNGVDTRAWDPATDPLLPAHFDARDLAGKEACAQALLRRFSLTLPPTAREFRRPPIFGAVGRMADQKGVDLLQALAPNLLRRGARLVVVGTGEPRHEDAWRLLAARWPGRLGLVVGFDEPLAHLVEAGSDFFLMPSRFEPCGLNQLYSQRYGTVPVVHAVGGLRDTVVDLAQPGATGITFQDATAAALEAAVERALALYDDPVALAAVRQRGMARDDSWERSARAYQALYRRLVDGAPPPGPGGTVQP